MLEVTYSMLALTAVLLFPALVHYILRSDEKKTEQKQVEADQQPLQDAQNEQYQQQQQDGNESSSCLSLSDREADDNSNDFTKGSSCCEPQSPASVVYVSFDCDNKADKKKDDNVDKKKTKEEENIMSYRHEYSNRHDGCYTNNRRSTFNIFPLPPDYYNSSDESDESLLLEANQPEDFHKLLSQTGSEMMRSCLSIEDLVQAKIKHE